VNGFTATSDICFTGTYTQGLLAKLKGRQGPWNIQIYGFGLGKNAQILYLMTSSRRQHSWVFSKKLYQIIILMAHCAHWLI
jgi:hypothetical protein